MVLVTMSVGGAGIDALKGQKEETWLKVTGWSLRVRLTEMDDHNLFLVLSFYSVNEHIRDLQKFVEKWNER